MRRERKRQEVKREKENKIKKDKLVKWKKGLLSSKLNPQNIIRLSLTAD